MFPEIFSIQEEYQYKKVKYSVGFERETFQFKEG